VDLTLCLSIEELITLENMYLMQPFFAGTAASAKRQEENNGESRKRIERGGKVRPSILIF